MIQEKYWKEFDQLKTHVNYIELYFQSSVCIDRYLNIFVAIASSGGVGAWLIWKEASYLWACIIGLAQIFTVIKEFLPYKQRIKVLPSLMYDLDQLANDTEADWHAVANGGYTEVEINNLWHKVKKKKTDIVYKYLKSSSLPSNDKLMTEAEEITCIYMKNFYSN